MWQSVYFGLAGTLLIKVAWNFYAPYASLKKSKRGEPGAKSISLMLSFEWILLLGASFSTLAGKNESAELPTFGATAVGGAASILASYLHGVVVGLVTSRQSDGRNPS